MSIYEPRLARQWINSKLAATTVLNFVSGVYQDLAVQDARSPYVIIEEIGGYDLEAGHRQGAFIEFHVLVVGFAGVDDDNMYNAMDVIDTALINANETYSGYRVICRSSGVVPSTIEIGDGQVYWRTVGRTWRIFVSNL